MLPQYRRRSSSCCTLAIIFYLLSYEALGSETRSQLSRRSLLMAVERVPLVSVPKIDIAAAKAEDDLSRSDEPPRFAVPFRDFSYTPSSDGVWERNEQGWNIWRLRINAPNALHVNLGFTDYEMPDGGSLRVSGFIFTAANNQAHRELWTPLVYGSEVLLEVKLPPGVQPGSLSLVLTSINSGYRGFSSVSNKSGSCNVDVACPQGEAWQKESAAVAVYSVGGSLSCTGTMINNGASDRTPYFLTANHCGVSAGVAPSVVVYWNYETDTCGGSPNGSLSQSQSGSSLVATSPSTDFTLLRLNDAPDPSWNVHWAGWDRSGSFITLVVTIHHPSTDEKRISFENDDAEFVNDYYSNSVVSGGSYIRVSDWDLGTTEPGSSGSALFDFNHRIIGQLHGGAAACGNNDPDWYGAIATSWNGGGTAQSRLRDWLDPNDGNLMTMDTLGPTGGPIPPIPASPIPVPPPPAPLPSCFSGNNVVYIKGKENPISITELAVGDYVKTCRDSYSLVYSFFHKHRDRTTSYLRVTTDTSMDGVPPLEISRNHMLPIEDGTMLRAADIYVGHVLAGGHVVSSVESIVRNGLYAPVTKQGNLMVFGICVSNYVALWDLTPWIQHSATHLSMSVFRMRCELFSKACAEETYDEETGFASPYMVGVAFIEWVRAFGLHAQLTVTLIGAPFLWVLYALESTLL